MHHKLVEEDQKIFLIQNILDDPETKKDLKMQDLKTFDEIKAQIKKYDEVKKEIETEAECVEAINKPNSYARAAKLKEGEYWQRARRQKEPRYRPSQNTSYEQRWK